MARIFTNHGWTRIKKWNTERGDTNCTNFHEREEFAQAAETIMIVVRNTRKCRYWNAADSVESRSPKGGGFQTGERHFEGRVSFVYFVVEDSKFKNPPIGLRAAAPGLRRCHGSREQSADLRLFSERPTGRCGHGVVPSFPRSWPGNAVLYPGVSSRKRTSVSTFSRLCRLDQWGFGRSEMTPSRK